MHARIAIAIMCMALIGCETMPAPAPAATAPEYLSPAAMKKMNLPFSEAVRVGDLLFLSGKIGNVPGTMNLVPGGIAGETRATMDAIKRTVENYGSSMDRVVKCTVFLADMAEWGAMNDVYRTYFKNPPARSALAAAGLALNARVEIECIAAM